MKEKMICRGDLFYYDFGDNSGSVQSGERPVLVVQADDYNQNAPTIIVAAVTSVIKKRYFPSHIILGEEFGLKKPSMVLLEQIRTVNREDLREYIGTVDDDKLFRQINATLKKTFGLWVYKPEGKEKRPKERKENYGELLSNVANFKGVMDKLFRRKRYKDCLEKIKAGDPKYQIVYYDAMYNQDRLDKMRISHDTLLEYGYQMIENYPRLRQIVIDYYPYVLIDEYQDTADIVVKIMNTIEQYAKEINHNMFIGYFGDSVQNIYEDGVGKKLIELHPELKKISKEYNRRSYREIIDVANKIRNDDIKQRSIYSDSTGGVVELYYGNQEDVKRFWQKNKIKNW